MAELNVKSRGVNSCVEAVVMGPVGPQWRLIETWKMTAAAAWEGEWNAMVIIWQLCFWQAVIETRRRHQCLSCVLQMVRCQWAWGQVQSISQMQSEWSTLKVLATIVLSDKPGVKSNRGSGVSFTDEKKNVFSISTDSPQAAAVKNSKMKDGLSNWYWKERISFSVSFTSCT
jgi:hypothetical protein